MENTLSVFIHRLEQILMGRLLSVHLYGSCVMDDFQPGWAILICFASQIGPSRRNNPKSC